MPFMYHRRNIANIDRSRKRKDEFIIGEIEKSIQVVRKRRLVALLPTINDPNFDVVNPRNFLVTYAIRELGLSWYEVEYFLDNLSSSNLSRYQFHKWALPFLDERRRYYQKGKHPSNSFFYFGS